MMFDSIQLLIARCSLITETTQPHKPTCNSEISSPASFKMTWGAFFAALRRDASQKTAVATRRGGLQQQQRAANRTVSSQATQQAFPKKTPPVETWDFYMLDVSSQ
jgi:hypothetical protein